MAPGVVLGSWAREMAPEQEPGAKFEFLAPMEKARCACTSHLPMTPELGVGAGAEGFLQLAGC